MQSVSGPRESLTSYVERTPVDDPGFVPTYRAGALDVVQLAQRTLSQDHVDAAALKRAAEGLKDLQNSVMCLLDAKKEQTEKGLTALQRYAADRTTYPGLKGESIEPLDAKHRLVHEKETVSGFSLVDPAAWSDSGLVLFGIGVAQLTAMALAPAPIRSAMMRSGHSDQAGRQGDRSEGREGVSATGARDTGGAAATKSAGDSLLTPMKGMEDSSAVDRICGELQDQLKGMDWKPAEVVVVHALGSKRVEKRNVWRQWKPDFGEEYFKLNLSDFRALEPIVVVPARITM